MSFSAIKARNERWREEGKLPGAKGTGTEAQLAKMKRHADAVNARRFELRVCAHLGDRVSGACGELARRCNLHGTTTSAHTKCPKAERHCPTCADFAPSIGAV